MASVSSSSSSSLFLVSNFRNFQIPKSKTLISPFRPSNRTLLISSSNLSFQSSNHQKMMKSRIAASITTAPEQILAGPDDLVASILSKVRETDGGVSLSKEGHEEVAKVAQQLTKFCVDEPVKNPLIFGEWDVIYCSRPTSPGGGYRSTIGRLVFKTKEMVQVVEAPDTIRNMVSFSAFGFLDGEVSLKGKLKVLDDKWIQVIFEAPRLKVGALDFQYGGESEVKLEITYIDEKIRLGKGSRALSLCSKDVAKQQKLYPVALREHRMAKTHILLALSFSTSLFFF